MLKLEMLTVDLPVDLTAQQPDRTLDRPKRNRFGRYARGNLTFVDHVVDAPGRQVVLAAGVGLLGQKEIAYTFNIRIHHRTSPNLDDGGRGDVYLFEVLPHGCTVVFESFGDLTRREALTSQFLDKIDFVHG